MSNDLATYQLSDMQTMAVAVAKSGLFGMKTPEQALALMLVAQSENMHPATITQDYDIIQGKAYRKTHSVMARFQQMGGSVQWHELTDQIADATFSHPKGGSLRITWTFEQAQRAHLTGKDNWKNYPRAMLRARCIAEGVRAVYPAAIGGMMVVEEAQDTTADRDAPTEPKHMGPAEVVPQSPAHYPAAEFDKNLPAWRKVIETGKKTAADLIAMVETKGSLTDEQKATLRAIKPPQPASDVQDVQPKDEAPAFTYAQVADKLSAATDVEQLAEAGSLIGAVSNADHRAELVTLYEQRSAEMEAA